jgi:hypothetical protein
MMLHEVCAWAAFEPVVVREAELLQFGVSSSAPAATHATASPCHKVLAPLQCLTPSTVDQGPITATAAAQPLLIPQSCQSCQSIYEKE